MLKAHVISRVAAVALIAVFVGTALLTLSSARSIRENRARSDEAQVMSARFAEASRHAKEAERYIGLWSASGEPAYLVEQKRSQEAFAAALDDITATSRAEDREFGEWAKVHFGAMSRVFDRLFEVPPPPFGELLEEYAVAYATLYTSVADGDIGDPQLAQQLIDPSLVTDVSELTSNPVAIIMASKVAERDMATAEALRAVGISEDRFRSTAPPLYIFGTLLAVALLGITIRFGRREAVTFEANAQLRRLATTDALTELGNQRGFEEATRRLATTPDGVPVSLIVMDLDEFKVVNDTFGHARGDAVLAAFAALLSRLAPPGVSRFRVGGDEFALLCHGLDEGASMALAQHVRHAAAAELGSGVSVTAGVAMLDPGDKDECLLRQRADAALYEGKLRGRNVAVLYTHEGSTAPVFPSAKVDAVRQLLDEGRIETMFEPIWEPRTRAIFGYTGVSRPNDDYGLSGPEEAFDVAEQFGHAADLDRLCREKLLAAASVLPAAARIFLSISPYALTEPSFSARSLVAECEGAGCNRDRVVFEVTGKSRVSRAAMASAVSSLRAEGLCVALNDVGAGNSGLGMLRTVEVDFVKVDKSVIRAAAEAGRGRAVLAAILAFCRESGTVVVAESLDDTEILACGRASSGNTDPIDGVQGLLFGSPGTAAESSVERPPVLAA